jgi:hypothetical protein
MVICMAKKNDWVQISRVVLEPAERTGAIPEETKKVPLRMWVKGRLNADAEVGDTVSVTTRTGRTEWGILLEVSPVYKHTYGDFVPEILEIGDAVRRELFCKGSEQKEGGCNG